jgi:hypothetical protein
MNVIRKFVAASVVLAGSLISTGQPAWSFPTSCTGGYNGFDPAGNVYASGTTGLNVNQFGSTARTVSGTTSQFKNVTWSFSPSPSSGCTASFTIQYMKIRMAKTDKTPFTQGNIYQAPGNTQTIGLSLKGTTVFLVAWSGANYSPAGGCGPIISNYPCDAPITAYSQFRGLVYES